MTRRQSAVSWEISKITRVERWRALSSSGGTVWFTGLSGSGKSSIAKHIEADLVEEGIPAYVLDGDNLRHGINDDLGFSRQDRGENCRRAAEIARLFADAGVISLVALISPYAEDRTKARAMHEVQGLPFLEVYVGTPAAVCEERDPKGLYAQARAGEIEAFTSLGDPYEVPENPDVALGTSGRSIDDNAHAVIELIRARILSS
ncbi:MAG: adenylyl-sulfate kinase [Acidimicrobiales bacterium]